MTTNFSNPPMPTEVANGGSFRRGAGMPTSEAPASQPRKALAPLPINQTSNVNLNTKLKVATPTQSFVCQHPLRTTSSTRNIPPPPPLSVEDPALATKSTSVSSFTLAPMPSLSSLQMTGSCSCDAVGTMAADAPPPPAPRPSHITAPRLFCSDNIEEIERDEAPIKVERAHPALTHTVDDEPVPVSARSTGGVVLATRALNRYLFVKNFVVRPRTPTSSDRRLNRLMNERNEADIKINVNTAPFQRGNVLLKPLHMPLAGPQPMSPPRHSDNKRAARRSQAGNSSAKKHSSKKSASVALYKTSPRRSTSDEEDDDETDDRDPACMQLCFDRKNSTARRIADFDFEDEDERETVFGSIASPVSDNFSDVKESTAAAREPSTPLRDEGPASFRQRQLLHNPNGGEDDYESIERSSVANDDDYDSVDLSTDEDEMAEASVVGQPPSVAASPSPGKGAHRVQDCISALINQQDKYPQRRASGDGMNSSFTSESPQSDMASFTSEEHGQQEASIHVDTRPQAVGLNDDDEPHAISRATAGSGKRNSGRISPFARPATSFGRRQSAPKTARTQRSRHSSLTSSDAGEPFCTPPFEASDSGHHAEGRSRLVLEGDRAENEVEDDFEEPSPSVGMQIEDDAFDGSRRDSGDRRSVGAMGREGLTGSSSTNSVLVADAEDEPAANKPITMGPMTGAGIDSYLLALKVNAVDLPASKKDAVFSVTAPSSLPSIIPPQRSTSNLASLFGAHTHSAFASTAKPPSQPLPHLSSSSSQPAAKISSVPSLPSLAPTANANPLKGMVTIKAQPTAQTTIGPSVVLGLRRKSYNAKPTSTPTVTQNPPTTDESQRVRKDEIRAILALLASCEDEKQLMFRRASSEVQLAVLKSFYDPKSAAAMIVISSELVLRSEALLSAHQNASSELAANTFTATCERLSLEMQSRQQRAHIEMQRDLFLYHTVETFIAIARLVDFDDREEEEEGTLWARLVSSEQAQKRQAQERAHRRRARSYKADAQVQGDSKGLHMFDRGMADTVGRSKFREAMQMHKNEGLCPPLLPSLPSVKGSVEQSDEIVVGGAPYLPVELTQLNTLAVAQMASLRQREKFRDSHNGGSAADIDAQTQRIKSIVGIYSAF